MAGYVKNPEISRSYETFTSASDAVVNGMFLVPDYSDKTAAIPTDDATGFVMFVENEIDQPVMEGTDDAAFSVDTGALLKLHKPVEGAKYITTAIGTATLAAGDECGVGANGAVYAIADLTAIDFTGFHVTFIVEEVTTLFSADALVLVAKVK